MRITSVWLVAFASLFLSLSTAAAERRQVRAARTATPPVIDGRVDEAVWSQAPEITDLVQQRPDNGEPSSEPIRIHLLYDNDALYVGAVMTHRKSPVIRLLARRDTFLDSDWFGIMIDSQLDRRSALGFFVNPDGVQLDEAVTDDVTEDYEWDSVWQSAATVHEGGWSAELRIPFTLLRFTPRPQQTWGVQFIRWVRARQEQARLVAHPRNQKGFVSRFGDLAGLDGINPRPKLEFQPYSTVAAVRNGAIVSPDPFRQRAQTIGDVGLDLRWTARSAVTLNATLNPDFGQVEVDPAVLNLSEFEVFFPEKRPFFVEGAKLFSFGTVATSYTSPFRVAHPILFHSRRIGREPLVSSALTGDFMDVPQSTRILGAAKLTARVGETTISAIDAFTDVESVRMWRSGLTTRAVVQPRTNHFVARLTRDLGEHSRIGSLVTSVVRGGGGPAALARRATVAGIDGYRYFGNGKLLVDWMVAGSEVDGTTDAVRALQLAPAHMYQRPDASHIELDPSATSLRGWGGKAVVSRETGTWRYQAGLQKYSPGFELNELGFHSRSDLTAGHLQLTWLDVAKRKRTRQNRITTTWFHSENGDRDVLTEGITLQYANLFTNWWQTSASVSFGERAIDDRETRGGPAMAKPAGWSSQLRVVSNTAKRVWVDVTRNDAHDENGGGTHLTQATLAFRPRSNITAQLTAVHATTVTASKFFTSVADANATTTFGRRWIFGRLLERRLEIAPRLDWTIHRTLSLQLFLQPLAASGEYNHIGELAKSRGDVRGYDAVTRSATAIAIDPDADGPSSPFSVFNPDFTFRSFRGNAVVRWEVGPATIFAVWNEGRQLRQTGRAVSRLDNLQSVGEAPAEDRFLLKVSYRFEFPK